MSNTASSDGSFASLLTVAFIVMKLTGYISWSWWWVLSPLWISFGIGILIAIPILLFLDRQGML